MIYAHFNTEKNMKDDNTPQQPERLLTEAERQREAIKGIAQTAQEEVKREDKIIIGDNENISCIADQIEQVFKSHLDDKTRIELSAKISYYYFKNGINQYRKWKTESDNKLSSLQQEVDKMRELLKESKRFCGGSLQARIDNLLN